jgi:hypothetical protein
VDVLGDTLVEGTESFVVEVVSITNGTLEVPRQLTISILDNDAGTPPPPTARTTTMSVRCDPTPAVPTYRCVAEVATTDGVAPPPAGRVNFAISGGAGAPTTASCDLTPFPPPVNRSSCSIQASARAIFATSVVGTFEPQGAFQLAQAQATIPTFSRATSTLLHCDHAPAAPNYLCIAEVSADDGAAPPPTGQVNFAITAGNGTFNPATARCTLTPFPSTPPAAPRPNRSSCAVQLTTTTTTATVRARYEGSDPFLPSEWTDTAFP